MAASLKEISPELCDSITDFLGTQEVFLLAVRLHIKSRVEDAVLVLLPWRALVLQPKLPFKVQASFSFLALQRIKMGEVSQVVIETNTAYELEFLSLEDLESAVIHMVMFLKKIFPNSSPWNLLQNASPSLLDRIQKITYSLEEVIKENQGPCGGYSESYAILCDYSSLPLREEIQWAVDNTYHKHECKEFNLLDFGSLDSQDVAIAVAALSLNQWFTRLYCKDIKLNPDIVDQILYVLSKSVTLEELVFENCGLKLEFAQRLAQVLGKHPDSALHTVNLSGNLLEDRGIIAFSQNFEQHFKSLQSLSLARTSVTAKGMVVLCQSLVSNGLFRTSLCHLDLSGNPGSLATDDVGGLYLFLSQSNALVHLDLSGTDCPLDLLFGALASGCCRSLVHLNLSKNVYSHKKNREVPPAIGKFFRKASVLQQVSLAGTKLPPEALRALLQGLARNAQLSDLHLDLSSCELRSAGAQVIQDLVVDASSIGDLNLSDNGFDSDMVTLVLAISRSRSITHIGLGKNFNIRSRESLDDILHRIVQLTQDEDCSVKSLSVAESRLKLGTSILLESLGSGSSNLVTLDISGNAMGDFGAKILAKALSINTTLRTLIWDRNNTTVYGFLDVARALERNVTLKVMPLPVTDVALAYRSHPEKIEEVVHKIQSYLTRNQMQDTFPKENLQLQPASLDSSSEQILPFLYEAGSIPQQNGRFHHKLENFTEEVSGTSSRQIQALVQTVLDTVQSLCPTLLQKSSSQDPLIRTVPERVLLDRLLTEKDSKQTEIKQSVDEALARGILEKALEELRSIQDKLGKDLLKHDEELKVGNTEWSAFLQRHESLERIAEKGFLNKEGFTGPSRCQFHLAASSHSVKPALGWSVR